MTKEKIIEILTFPFLFIWILLFEIPIHMITNIWKCPYFDYPYGKCNSLLTGRDEPCRLGDAKYICCHYWSAKERIEKGEKNANSQSR